MKTENELAGLMAERFYELMREEAKARGVVSVFLPFHPWEETSELQREALTNVVARIMREAREQKEEWTRAFIENEVRRMRAAIENTPGRLRVIVTPDSEPFRVLECSRRALGCTWQTSTHYARPGDACANPAGCAGVFQVAETFAVEGSGAK